MTLIFILYLYYFKKLIFFSRINFTIIYSFEPYNFGLKRFSIFFVFFDAKVKIGHPARARTHARTHTIISLEITRFFLEYFNRYFLFRFPTNLLTDVFLCARFI